MADALGTNATLVHDVEKVPVDLEWRIPADLVPEGHDDPWLRGDGSTESDLFPLPAGYP